MSDWFFRSNRPGYPHPVSSELENSGIRVAVGDCSVTERRRWHPPYQTAKLCMCTQNTTTTTRTDAWNRVCAAMVRTAEPLGECRYENWNTHTHTNESGHTTSLGPDLIVDWSENDLSYNGKSVSWNECWLIWKRLVMSVASLCPKIFVDWSENDLSYNGKSVSWNIVDWYENDWSYQ